MKKMESGPGSEPEAAAVADDEELVESEGETFLDLGLSEASASGAADAGFLAPLEVQRRVIPPVLAARDVIACSETGSGKTGAFALPIFDRLDFSLTYIQVLVLVPTRELCQQVAAAFRELGTGHELRVAEVYGGVRYDRQRRDLSQHPQVVVGTPGRVLDLAGSGSLKLGKVRILVLDEADRMLDMGFYPQVQEVLNQVPRHRQTLMFSATIPVELTRLAGLCMTDPVQIQVGARARPPSQLVQEAISVLLREKEPKLLELVKSEPGSILIFTCTKSRADLVHRLLKDAGHRTCVIHSGWSQSDRKRALDGFTSGQYRIMVATDLAQRGLDIEGISLVVNYDLPFNPEDYVHRIGRTGRASAAGRAVSFITTRDYPVLKAIERLTGHTFKNLIPAARMADRRIRLKRRIR